MRRFVLAVAIACVLSGATFAGEIPSTDVLPPPPPATSPLVTVILTVLDAVTK